MNGRIMKRNYFFIVLFLVVNQLFAAIEFNFKKELLPPSASISGTTTVCLNASGVLITFTGLSGNGIYTFTYAINSVLQPTVSTTGNNNTVTVSVPTNVAGTFTYNLVSVQDNTGTQTINNQNAIVRVISGFSVNAGVDIKVCKGNPINLMSSVAGSGSNPVSYTWTGPNGFTSIQQSPTIATSTTTMSGNYTVTASIGNCQVQDIVNVQVINVGATNPASLNSCLTTGQTSALVGLILTLPSDTSLIQTITINWGDLSTPQVIPQSNWALPITHTYPSGSYTVTITATTTLGCNVTQTYIAFIGSSPQAATLSLFASQASGCSPHVTNFTFSIPISNSDGTNYLICFGDNTASCINYIDGSPIPSGWVFSGTAAGFNLYTITHIYNITSCGNSVNLNGTTYNNVFLPSVITTNPCTAPQPQAGSLISVGLTPTASFTPNPIPNICVNTLLTLNNTSNFGGTIDPITYSCTSTSPFYWTITPSGPGLWTASGLGSDNGFPTNELFWTPGAMTPSITFNQSGNYTITLNVKNSCGINSVSHTVCVEPPISPSFTVIPNSGCIPLSVTTNNTTVPVNQCSPTIYNWNVSYAPANCGAASAFTYTGGTSSTSASPSFNFTEAGIYTITLTATNSCTPPQITTQVVTVKKPPIVTLTNIANFCQSATLTPTFNISACTNTTPTYLWTFPGGTPSSSTSQTPPSVSYAIAGNHTITLAVTNECGTTTATSNTFNVLSSPTVQNETLTICSGIPFSITPSTATSGNIIPAGTTYTWNAPLVTGGMTGGVGGTNQTSINGTLLNPTSLVQTATYSVTPSVGSCFGNTFTVIVTVNPAAQVNQPIAVSVCNGATTSAINFTTTNPSGTTFSWTNSTPSIGLGASGNGNISAFMAVNTTNAPIIATITVTPSFSGGSAICSGVSKIFTITVNPSGQVNQPTSLLNCNGEVVSITFSTSNTGGTTIYNWTNDTPVIGLPATGTGIGNISFTATNSTNTPLVATIIVTPSYNNGSSICIGTSKTFTITINPSAQVNQPTAISVCNGNAIPTTTFSTLNTSGTTSYSWTNSNTAIGLSASGTGDIPAFTAINNGNSVLTATIIVTPSYLVGATTCTGNTKQFIISVSPNANLTLPSNRVVCNGSILSSITFTTTNTGGTTSYSWTNDTTSIGLAATGTGNIPIFTALNTGLVPIIATISVTPSFSNGTLVCSGASQTFTITVNPSSQVNSINNIEVCNGNAIPLTVFSTNNSAGVTTYSWTNSNISIGLAASGSGNIPAFIGTNTGSTQLIATITIIPTYTNAGVNCNGTSQSFTIKINPSPTGTISGTINVCLNAAAPQITFTGSAGNPPYIFTYNINNATNQTISTTSGNSVSINALTNTLGVFTYNLVNVQDSNATSCLNTLSQSVTVTVTAAPTINVPPIPSQSICVGGTIQNPLTVSFINGTGTPTYQWYSNTNNTTTGGIPVGTNSPNYPPPVYTTVGSFYYYVIISFSGNGCGSVTSAVAEIVVVNDPIVSTQPIATQTLCLNETPSNLTVTITGGIGTISYQWYSTSTSTNTGGTVVGTNSSSFTPPTNNVGTFYYYCSITQSGVACSVNSNSATVIINSSPTIVIQPGSSTVCQSGIPTTLSFTYSNGVGTPTYQWYSNSSPSNTGGSIITNAINPTYIPPSTSVGIFYYYCIITFPDLVGSCSSVATNVAIVTISPQSTIDVQPLPTQSICVGGTIQNPLTVTFINGTGTPTYQWYSNTNNTTTGGIPVGTNSPNYPPPVFTTVGSFYYYVIISFSGNGCGSVTSAVAEIVVVPDPIINVQPLTTQTICQFVIPATLSITVSGGVGTTYSYQWYSNIANNNTLGSIISGETNSTYTPPSTNAGTIYYYCVITQANGLDCNVTSAIAEVIVNLAPAIASQPVSSSICIGQTPTLLSVTYTNGVGTPQYQWYSNIVNSTVGGTPITGATSANFNPQNLTAATTYYYCVITFSSGGCSNITSNVAEVIINQNPVIAAQNPIICSGTAFTVTPNNSGGDIVPIGTTYSWTNPTINPSGSITGASGEASPQTTISQTLINTTTSPSTVVYTVTPLSGVCVGATFTITVTVNPSITPNTTVVNSLCYASNSGSITTNITGGIPFSSGSPYIISWTGPGGFTSSSANISALAPGIYNLTVTDFGGCPFSNNYTITEPAEIVITTDLEKDITCFDAADGEVQITITGGTTPYSFTWTKDSLPFATTEDISNLGPGVYIVSVTDANFCGPITATFTITEPPLLVVSIVNQTNVLCFGEATGAITINTIGGTPIQISPGVFDYTYSWTGPNGFVSSSQNLTNLQAGTYNLTVTDNSGCIKNLTVTLTQPTEIIITAVTTPITCYGANNASITVTITGGNPAYQIAWSNLAVGLYQSNLSAGNYTITVTDASGCQKALTITIIEAPIFTANPIVTQITCFGANNGSINLNLTGGIPTLSLVWSDGSTSGLIRNNLGPGTYSYTIIDGTPCTLSGTFTLIEPQALVLTANIANALNCNNANSGAINLLVSGGTPPFTYSWSNGVIVEDLTNVPAGNYSVTVTDSRGCVKTGQYSVTSPAPIVLNVNTTTVPNCPAFSINQNFSAQVSGGLPPYEFNWSSGVVSGINNQFMTTNQNGLIILTATDDLGCTANYTFNVTLPILADASFDINSIGYTNYGEFSIIDPIQFTNTAVGDFTSILWDFGDGTFSNEENPIHIYVNEGSYVVTQTVTYPFGCTYTHIITLVIKKGYLLVVPTAFTPNNDNLNDTFRPVTKALKDVRMDIYDTWGSVIYSEIGDVLIGWDATIKGVKAENGNYYCKVSGKTFYGTDVYENQTFVLVK